MGRRCRAGRAARRRRAKPDSLRPAFGFWLCEIVFLPHTAAVVGRRHRAHRCVRVLRHPPPPAAVDDGGAHGARAVERRLPPLRFWREMAAAPLLAAGRRRVAGSCCGRRRCSPQRRCSCCGSPRRRWRDCLSRPLPRRAPALPQPTICCACAFWRAAPGRSSRPSSAPPISGCRPTTSRKTRAAHRRGAPRRPTSACCSCRVLAALDFGYRGVLATALQLKNTFDTLDRMERYHGHFLNWYGTADLVPLEPRYVSTVDSGNLAACLLTVKQGCLRAARPRRSCRPSCGAAISTRWRCFREVIEPRRGAAGAPRPAARHRRHRALCRSSAARRQRSGASRIARLLDEFMPGARSATGRRCSSPTRLTSTPPCSATCAPGWSTSRSISSACSARWTCLLPWLEAWRHRADRR